MESSTEALEAFSHPRGGCLEILVLGANEWKRLGRHDADSLDDGLACGANSPGSAKPRLDWESSFDPPPADILAATFPV